VREQGRAWGQALGRLRLGELLQELETELDELLEFGVHGCRPIEVDERNLAPLRGGR
jgi:hypothetical protein